MWFSKQPFTLLPLPSCTFLRNLSRSFRTVGISAMHWVEVDVRMNLLIQLPLSHTCLYGCTNCNLMQPKLMKQASLWRVCTGQSEFVPYSKKGSFKLSHYDALFFFLLVFTHLLPQCFHSISITSPEEWRRQERRPIYRRISGHPEFCRSSDQHRTIVLTHLGGWWRPAWCWILLKYQCVGDKANLNTTMQ